MNVKTGNPAMARARSRERGAIGLVVDKLRAHADFGVEDGFGDGVPTVHR
jgi:hypothetical protein